MAGISIRINGVTELEGKLRRVVTLEHVKKVVEVNGDRLNKTMVGRAIFTRGYSTGATRRSINKTVRDGGLTAVVKPGMHYDAYVELGTRKMTPQPFVKPSFDMVKGQFISDLKRLMQ